MLDSAEISDTAVQPQRQRTGPERLLRITIVYTQPRVCARDGGDGGLEKIRAVRGADWDRNVSRWLRFPECSQLQSAEDSAR
jgi:hypothetical protein